MVCHWLSKLRGFQHDVIYELIAYQDLRLCLDIGAAAGAATCRIAEAGTADTRIKAFEPFPGNHQFFRDQTAGLDNVELIERAVSNRSGGSRFHVGTTVTGSKPGWERMRG